MSDPIVAIQPSADIDEVAREALARCYAFLLSVGPKPADKDTDDERKPTARDRTDHTIR